MKEFLEGYVKDIESGMDFDYRETYVSSFENLASLIVTIGGALSIVTCFIGIVNFVNSVLTSMITDYPQKKGAAVRSRMHTICSIY